jgi:tape measure domain-containing protein
MTIVDDLRTRFTLDAAQYDRAASGAIGTTKQLAAAHAKLAAAQKAQAKASHDAAKSQIADDIAYLQKQQSLVGRAPQKSAIGAHVKQLQFQLDYMNNPAQALRMQALDQHFQKLNSTLVGRIKNSGFKAAVFKPLSDGIDQFKDKASEALSALGPLSTLIGTIVGIGAAGAAAGYGLMKQAAEFDSLRQSLVSVEGDAKKAGDALARLKELAKAPGLGFEEAVRGYSGLRNAGLTQQFAERLIKEFANANARGGGNAETFGRILTQIRQAAGRQFLAQEDLTPIGEAGIPINKILKDTFGTGDTEELKKNGITAQRALEGIVDSLSKLQRVAGGQQNEFDNLGDAIKFALISAGEGLNQGLLPYVNKFSAAVSELQESGVIESAFSGIAQNVIEMLGGASDDTAASLIPLVAGMQTLSGGFRNLTLNVKEFIEWTKRLGFGLIPSAIGNAISDGTGLGDEYQRNVDDLMAQLDASRTLRGKSGTKGAGKSGVPGPNFENADNPVKPLLERIAVAVETTADLNKQAAGGGALTRDAISARNLAGLGKHGRLGRVLMELGDIVSEAMAQNEGRVNRKLREAGI